MRRKWLLIGAAFIGAVLLLMLAVAFMLPVDRFRLTLESALDASLGRQVRIGQLRLSVLKRTLTAEEVSVSEDETFGHSEFLHAKRMTVGVQVIPLLFSHRLRVNSLVLEEPQVNLLRSPSGRWNFFSLGGKANSAMAGRPAAEPSSTIREFSVQALEITNGRLSISRLPPGTSQKMYMDVNLTARDVSASASFPLSLELKSSSGGKIRLGGEAGPVDSNRTMENFLVHLKLEGQKIPVQGMEDLLDIRGLPLPPGTSLRAGTLNAKLSMEGSLERLVTAGSVSLSGVTFAGFDLAAKLGSLAAVAGVKGGSDTFIESMSFRLNDSPEGIRLDDLNVVVPDAGTSSGVGTIDPAAKLDLQLVAKLNPASGARAGVQAVAKLGQDADGFPFRIQGTTSNPVFVMDLGGKMGKALASPFKGLGHILSGHPDKKKK